MKQTESVSSPLSPPLRVLALVVAVVVLAVTIAACGGDEGSGGAATASTESESSLSGEIAGAGASSQEAAMQAWVATFQEQNQDVTIAYYPIGSCGCR